MGVLKLMDEELAGSIVAHMNEDHGGAVLAYARAFTEITDCEEALMIGVDRAGLALSCRVGEEWHSARVEFDEPLADDSEARSVLVLLARRAREQLAMD